jgi:hypothetical protein
LSSILSSGVPTISSATRYALRPDSDGHFNGQQGWKLASFDWIDLGAFEGRKLAEQVWRALGGGFDGRQVKATFPEVARETTFAVKVQIRPPRAHRRVLERSSAERRVD